MAVKIIRITDDPIDTYSDAILAPEQQIGEIIVKGPIISKSYYQRPKENAGSKIQEGDEIWHRMGDLGWIDANGRIWFCGRKKHRVVLKDQTLFSVNCEMIFNRHPDVYRSALVAVGPKKDPTPVICIEPNKKLSQTDQNRLRSELKTLAKSCPTTERIETILFHKRFPVDIRHNAKIFREKLAPWAEKKTLIPGS